MSVESAGFLRFFAPTHGIYLKLRKTEGVPSKRLGQGKIDLGTLMILVQLLAVSEKGEIT